MKKTIEILIVALSIITTATTVFFKNPFLIALLISAMIIAVRYHAKISRSHYQPPNKCPKCGEGDDLPQVKCCKDNCPF